MRATAPIACLAAVLLAAWPEPAPAQQDFGAWPVLGTEFPSTGGGGWMIGQYRPVVIGDRCATAFTATSPEGQVFHNIVLFTATRTQGGVLCTEGRWSAADGSGAGTTPLVVFLRDGVARGRP